MVKYGSKKLWLEWLVVIGTFLKVFFIFHDLIICKFDDDLINIKAVNAYVQPACFMDYLQTFLSPMTLKK